MAEPRLLQVFLSKKMHGVYEVHVIVGTKKLSCTCPGFANRRRCKHLTYVESRLQEDGGYAVKVSIDAADACREARSGSAEEWRAFVIKHCPAVVL